MGNFGGGVFDVLGFVEDGEAEVVLFEFVDIALQESEAGDDDVGVGDVGKEAASFRALEHEGGERGSELFDFGDPVWNHGSGGDDEDGSGLGEAGLENVGEGLEGFSEAHVIGEDAIEVVELEEIEPLDAFFLVGAEFGAESFGLAIGGVG